MHMVWKLAVLLTILILLILSVSRWKWHPFIALLLAALSMGLLLGLGGAQAVEVLLEGFGNTLKWIGIIVVLGAFIGEVLRETGGALRISDAVVKWVGERKLPWAMGITGYLVSIPVFVDVAYIVLQPVTEALAVRSKRPVLVIGLALTAGLTVSHTLIPPTPGPLAVASLLEADIGRLLLINGFVGLFAMTGGIIWAARYCKNAWIAYDEKLAGMEGGSGKWEGGSGKWEGGSGKWEGGSGKAESGSGKAESGSERAEGGRGKAPPVLLDLLPILAPIVLMGFGAFYSGEEGSLSGQIVAALSTPMIAVLIGAGIAWLQFRRVEKTGRVNQLVEQAIVKSALVIMITGAGGAFGYVIRESGIQDSLASFFADLPFLGFLLPFLIAAVLTTATGSITVSLIGAASILGPMAGGLPYSPEMMAALIGAGSFCVFHANASFFWLLNRLHEAPVEVLYRNYTTQSLVMGLSGLVGVVLLRLLGVA